MKNRKLKTILLSTAALLAVAVATTSIGPVVAGQGDGKRSAADPNKLPTKYPIKHLVVIFGENISFDHYFGTYPNALNPPGQPKFHALPNTPTVNGLTPTLLTNNPNLKNPANGDGASNPFRLNRSQALTEDMNHDYGPEQA